MNSIPALFMLLIMICAASCVFIEKCRTLANMICAIVMVLSMIDIMYTNIFPPLFLATTLITTGIWAAISTWMTKVKYSNFVAVHRMFSAFFMGWLLVRHAVTTMPDHAHHHMHHSDNTFSLFSLASGTSILLFIIGLFISLAIVAHLQRTQQNKRSAQFAALEPALMGLSLIFMAI